MLTHEITEWVYERGQWKAAPAGFWGEGDTVEFKAALAQCGFSAYSGSLVVGDDSDVFEGRIHSRLEGRPRHAVFGCFRWAIELIVDDWGFTVFIPDLPSLWMFAREASSISTLINFRQGFEERDAKLELGNRGK